MLLLLGILKRNHKYFMKVVNTEKECEIDNYQFINPHILNNCVNINVQRYLSNKQDPREYLKGEFDVANLIVDDKKLRDRINDYQIISVYYDDNKRPCLYQAVDRAGNISMHDVSEFEYTKRNSLLGDDFNNLPSFVERKSLLDAYQYFNDNKVDDLKIADMSVGLAKHYLIATRGFKEGYHTVTKINHGIPLSIHEDMLFNGTATFKLVEYVTKDKNVYLTKQDNLTNLYPKERTVDFLSSPIVLLGSKRLIPRFCNTGINTQYSYYNNKAIIALIPFANDFLDIYDKHIKSKDVHTAWKLDGTNNLPHDIYRNILPNEIYKMPSRFYRDMKNAPFSVQHSYRLERENVNIELWMYTVALFICWQYYSTDFKKRLKPIIENYQEMYMTALNKLVSDIGPRDTLVVMKWMKDHLKIEMKNIVDSDLDVVDENSCLFTFHQNDYDLLECLKVYSEDTIALYGGVEKLKADFDNSSKDKRLFIINSLEKIEKDLKESNDLQVRAANSLNLVNRSR